MSASAATSPPSETQARLFDAALTLFADKGYAGASVREIIEAAGVTRPVLYYYCADKEDLYRRLIHDKHAAAYKELERLIGATTECRARLQAILHGTFAFCAADPRVPRLMFQTHYGPTIPGIAEFMEAWAGRRFTLIRDVMQTGVDRGELAAGDAAALALAFCGLMDQQVQALVRLPEPASRLTAELADQLLNLFWHGAGTGPRGPVALPPIAGLSRSA